MLLRLEKRVDRFEKGLRLRNSSPRSIAQLVEQGAGIRGSWAGISLFMTPNEADNGRREGVNSSMRPREFQIWKKLSDEIIMYL